MPNPIVECIENFGPAPRTLSFWDQLTYLRIGKPLWLRMDSMDDMNVLFRHKRALLKNGRVVWGHVVQANSLMYEDEPDNCPGEIVYSLADSGKATPKYLARLASRLYSLKGTRPTDLASAKIAAHLTDEMTRVYGLKVPIILSPKVRCQISTTFFCRKHLPQRKLCKSILPIIVYPQKPFVALPLPERFWPKKLIEWWIT